MILPMNGGRKNIHEEKTLFTQLPPVTERRCFRRGEFLPGKEDVEKFFRPTSWLHFLRNEGDPETPPFFHRGRVKKKRKGKKKKKKKDTSATWKVFFIHFPLSFVRIVRKSKRERNVSRRNVFDPSRVSIIHRRIEFLKRHIRSFTASCLGHKRRGKAVKHFVTFHHLQSIPSILRTTSIDPRSPMNRRDRS